MDWDLGYVVVIRARNVYHVLTMNSFPDQILGPPVGETIILLNI